MSKLTESFRTVRVVNPYDFYQGRPYVWYQPNGPSRSMVYAAWMVAPPRGKKFEGHWHDYGNKSFGLYDGDGGTHAVRKATSLAMAISWAKYTLGIQEWAKDPYGSYGEAKFVKARISELKVQVVERRTT